MRKKAPGAPRRRSGLPPPILGQPFSLIGTLRRCTRMLTVADAAYLLNVTEKQIYEQIAAGKIPVADMGQRSKQIDPAAWLLMLEKKNPHLVIAADHYAKAA